MTEPLLPGDELRSTSRVPPAVWALAAIGLLWGGWQVVSFGMRAYVDSRIERNVGAALIAFELTDLDGRVWRSDELRGKTVVLHFFRSKCVSCFAERDSIAELEQRVDPERVVLLGVLLDRVQGYSDATTQDTLARLDYHHPILVADTKFVDTFHGAGWAHVTPITYVVDGGGKIVASLRGRQDLASIEAVLPAGSLRAGSERPR